METQLSREQLNSLDKEILVTLFLNLQDQLAKQTAALENLTEQIAIMNNNRFGRSSETIQVLDNQLSYLDRIFNEAEYSLAEPMTEPDMDEVIVPEHKRKKRKGKREDNLLGFEKEVIPHKLTEEELNVHFPEGYTQLEDEIYKKLEMIPAQFKVLEHHIAVYKGKNGQIIKAPHPKEMLNNSIATPSLLAGILNAKYTNAMPLYRQEQEFARNDVNISRQVMSGWAIKAAERYFSLVYDQIKEEVLRGHVIHADETPVLVTKDGRKGMHKNYMWVYVSGERCDVHPAVLYEYQRTRKADAPRAFLKGFEGKLVCDGYQVYHALENEPFVNFEVAGCWIHARRYFAESIKALKENKGHGTVAEEAVIQIQNICHTDNSFQNLSQDEYLKKRQTIVKPLVDSYFKWCRESENRVPSGSKTGKGIQYSLNQEKYLRVFLSDPQIPHENNAAERAIRPFCVGKKNWMMIDTMRGAEASAVIYSIVETAKANSLNIYQYFKYLLTEIPKHMDDTNLSFLDNLLPWSENLPAECRKKK